MNDEDRILRMLDDMMESGKSAEEACARDPNLLAELRSRWKHLQSVSAEIEALFPDERVSADREDFTPPSSDPGLPHIAGYEIEEVIGRGGVGVVYKATHLKLARRVALKMLLAGVYAGSEERSRLMREARAVATLGHPHIVQVYDVGELNGCPYFTMEFLEGGSLFQKQAGKPQPPREAAALLAILAGAMQVAHQSGIIHRDLKPSNVLLTADGTPKITDFGLARRVDGDDEVTQAGVRLGTPSYMAPEQALGMGQAIGPPADIYALGAILYELLTGRPPFHGATSLETVSQSLLHDPVPPARLIPQVPRDLDTICLKCLEKLPEKRYGTAAELAVDLERFLRGEPIRARPVGMVEHLARWTRRHQGIAAALAAVVVLVSILVTGSLIAAEHFRELEASQRALALEKGRLAVEESKARLTAVEAEGRETDLRKLAEKQGDELRHTLYLAQMNLAGQAAMAPSGLGRVLDRLGPWENERPDLRGWEWYYLDGLCHRDLLTLTGHADDVMDVAWRPDGGRLASCGAGGTVKIWDPVDGRRVINIHAHSAVVYSLAWRPDGKQLATAGWDRTVKIWDGATGAPLRTFQCTPGSVYSVAWNPDGTKIASAGANGTILLWDAESGKLEGELHGHAGRIFTLAWSRDGSRIASGGEDSSIRLWEPFSAKQVGTLHGHINWVRKLAWSPDGKRLASASNDGTAKIWDTDARTELLTLGGHTLAVSSIGWSPDGNRVATASEDQTLKVWNAVNGAEIFTLRGHALALNAVQWSPDGTRLASGSADMTVKIWDAAAGPEIPVLSGHIGGVTSIGWSANGERLASCSTDGTIRIWDVRSRHEELTSPAYSQGLTSLAWSPDARRIACAAEDGAITIWNVGTRQQSPVLRNNSRGTVFSLSWSPDGKQLASGGEDMTLRIWDAMTGSELHACTGHIGQVRAVAWSPDGRHIASGGSEGSLKIWDAQTGANAISLIPHRSAVKSLAWSPDGKFIAAGSSDQTITIIVASSGATALRLRGHNAGVNAVAWTPRGDRLASCADDRSVRIWDLAAGKEALTIERAPDRGLCLAWSPDGTILAVGGFDRSIALYDATAGYAASWSPRFLSALDARLADAPLRSADCRLRALIHAGVGEWDQAAADLRQYFALEPAEHWCTLGYWVAGPYPEDPSGHFAPETQDDPNVSLAGSNLGGDRLIGWQSAPSNHEGFVNLGTYFGNADHISAYAMLKVYCPAKEQQVALLLGADDEVRLWLNGKQIYENMISGEAAPDRGAVAATLHPGWNTLLARVINLTGAHALYLRLSDAPVDLERAKRAAGK